MVIVLVVHFKGRVAGLTLPVADKLEGTRAGSRLRAHLILEYVHVEVGGSRVILRLPSEQGR